MIQVRIELVSAISGKTSEIGRMYITNDASGSADRGNYDVGVCRRGTTAIPVPNGGLAAPARAGKVTDYPRLAYNVWRLIARAVLSAFPEERTTKPGKAFSAEITPEAMRGLRLLTPEAMRGLRLLQRHLEDDGHDWTEGTDMYDVEAACTWLDAAYMEQIIDATAREGEIAAEGAP